MEQQVRRLVTRSDFDGLACAMMLKELQLIDEIKFVHPKDVQDGKIELSKNDITTNLPYDPRVSLAFDHHESEMDRLKAVETGGKLIIDPKARSAARVVYDYYGGKEAFPRISEDLMAAVDKGDSADFTMDEILDPKGWVLLHYLMDARTGLGRFHHFRISNYDLMMELIDYCLDHDIDDVDLYGGSRVKQAGFRWVMGYGSQLEVLAPADIRSEMQRSIRQALALYDDEGGQ